MNKDKIDKFHSEFVRFRVSPGTIKNEGKKLKPNSMCPCGSNMKYKKCCKQELENIARNKQDNNITTSELPKANLSRR